MERKKRIKRNLEEMPTQCVDSAINSPNFFNISYIPESFTSGKNLVKLKGVRPHFVEDSEVLFEILDSNKEPLYYEIIRELDDDGALSIAVYVYPDTPSGNCTITFVGTSVVDLNLSPLDKNKIHRNNIKYIHRLTVNETKVNESLLRFKESPTATVSERKYSVIEEKFQNITGSIGTSGSKERIIYTTASYKNIYGTPVITTTSAIPFIRDFKNGKIEFLSLDDYHPVPTFPTRSFSYTATITDIKTPLIMEVSESAMIRGINGEDHLVTKITNQPAKVTFSWDSKDRNVTQNVKTYAVIDIDKMEPVTGQVDRIKVFYKSANNPNVDYRSIYDYEVVSKNVLVDSSSKFVEMPLGKFDNSLNVTNAGSTSETLNSLNYWYTGSNNNSIGVTRILSNNRLFGGLSLAPDQTISGSTELYILQKETSKTTYYADTKYVLKFDFALNTTTLDNRQHKIEAYASGSAFVSDTQYGKFIGDIQTTGSIKTDQTFNLTVDFDGLGQLRFLLSPGAVIANIRVEEDTEFGFNPKRVKLYVPIKSEHKNEYLDFKIQFFNSNLDESNKSVELFSNFFAGGNEYIYGNDNLITGSAYLSPYTSSGIQMFADITGSNSGSAIQSTGYGGVEKAKSDTGSLSNFGFGITVGNPYSSSSYSDNTVQMINESGNVIDF